jgi:hypothetical protein
MHGATLPVVVLAVLVATGCGGQAIGTGEMKWTPNFGPGVKVVRGACSKRSRSDEEEYAHEVHPGVQGEGRDRGAPRAGDGLRDPLVSS